MTSTDRKLCEQIRAGKLPFVKIVDMPVVMHTTINEKDKLLSKHAVEIATRQYKSLKELIDDVIMNRQMLYIYPNGDSLIWHEGSIMNVNSITLSPEKNRFISVRVGRGNLSSYQADQLYKSYDAEAEITKMFSNNMAKEIDKEIMNGISSMMMVNNNRRLLLINR